MHRNTRIIKELYDYTLDEISKTGLDFLELNEDMQCGESFAERISKGVEEVFNKGYENVLVIGNDCPNLKSTDLISAKNELQKGKQIIGVTSRGGAYLIGIQKRYFKTNEFQQLGWNSKGLANELSAYLEGQTQLFKLNIKRDLNSILDLVLTINNIECAALKFRLLALSKAFILFRFSFNISFKETSSFSKFSKRGPPFYFSI